MGHKHKCVKARNPSAAKAAVAADLLRGGHGGAGKISLAAGMRDLLARSRLADDELAEQV